MPTVITHAVVGWGLARSLRARGEPAARAGPRELLAAVLPVLPDLDVVAFQLGIPYGHPLGHRGASHSLASAALLALLAWIVLRRLTRLDEGEAPAAGLRDAVILWMAAASHGLLDMATDGGRGVALLAPADTTRLFWPVRPIPVSPIGVGGFFSRGLPVLAWEVVLLWPLAGLGLLAGPDRPLGRRLVGAAAAAALAGGALAWRLGGGA